MRLRVVLVELARKRMRKREQLNCCSHRLAFFRLCFSASRTWCACEAEIACRLPALCAHSSRLFLVAMVSVFSMLDFDTKSEGIDTRMALGWPGAMGCKESENEKKTHAQASAKQKKNKSSDFCSRLFLPRFFCEPIGAPRVLDCVLFSPSLCSR